MAHASERIELRLVAGLIVTLLSITGPPTAAGEATGLQDGLLVHYAFDGDSETKATDSSGNGRVGAIAGAQRVPGVAGRALSFDGVDDFVSIADSKSLHAGSAFSLSVWLRSGFFTRRYEAVVTKGDTSWRVQRAGMSDSLSFDTTGTTVDSVRGTPAVTDGTWHHITVTLEGGRKKLYVDGELRGESTLGGPVAENDYDVMLAANAEAVERHLHGDIDELRIYGRALSEAEIKRLVSLHLRGPVSSLPAVGDGSGALARAAGLDKAGRREDAIACVVGELTRRTSTIDVDAAIDVVAQLSVEHHFSRDRAGAMAAAASHVRDLVIGDEAAPLLGLMECWGLYHREDYAEAIAASSALASDRPRDALAMSALLAAALAHAQGGDDEQARALVSRVISSPVSSPTAVLRGRLLLAWLGILAGETGEAKEVLAANVRDYPRTRAGVESKRMLNALKLMEEELPGLESGGLPRQSVPEADAASPDGGGL